MTNAPAHSAAANAWLREVEQRIASLPAEYRDDILSGLRTHLDESRAAGQSEADALARLGTPRTVAEGAVQQYQQDTGIDPRPRYFTVERWLQFIALAFAVAAVLAVALLPSYIQVSQTTSSSGAAEEVIESDTVLQVVGVWFLLVLAIPVLLALLPILATGKAWQPLSIPSAVLLGIFTVCAATPAHGSVSIMACATPGTPPGAVSPPPVSTCRTRPVRRGDADEFSASRYPTNGSTGSPPKPPQPTNTLRMNARPCGSGSAAGTRRSRPASTRHLPTPCSATTSTTSPASRPRSPRARRYCSAMPPTE